jgi:hypothetical protein
MKRIIFLLFSLFLIQKSRSQVLDKPFFAYSAEKMEKVLQDVESKFKIKYSYIDSIIAKKRITIPKRKYSLQEINESIEIQTDLKITKIDNRFYSISKEKKKDSVKTYWLKDVLVEGFLAKGIETLPGVTDADILLSLQQLPGVKSPNETASGLHVRGGTSDQNLILWDGIRLYHPGHLFGMISGINPNVNQTVSYYNKSTSPKFGERISSVIDIKSSDDITDRTKAKAGINALNADLYFQVPILKNKLGLQISGRKSFTEWLQLPTFNQLADKVFQNTNFTEFDTENQFQFQDYSVKINFKPSDKTSISLTGLIIDNNLDFTTESSETRINTQEMNIFNQGFSLNWTQKLSSKWTQKVLVFYSIYDFDYDKKQQFSSTDFEAFKKLNRIVDSGAELNWSSIFSDKWSLDYGYQLFGNDVSHLFSSYNQNIAFDLSLKHVYNITHVGYLNLKYDTSKWNFKGGVRYNHYNKIGANSYEPRFFVQRHLNDHFIWQASYERKSQIVSQVRENVANDLSLENYVWIVSENNDYPVQRGNQFTSGFIFKKNKWLVDIDFYYKNISGITSFTLGFINQAVPTVNSGKGFTKGIDFLIQKSAPTWRAWITYTYQDSQNQFNGINQNQYFQINSNIKHAFNVAFNKKWNDFSIALGWFLHSGKPFSLLNQEGQIATFNSNRLPAYHRFDISAIYEFYKADFKSFKLGISLYNAYNRKTIISKELERSYANVIDYSIPKYRSQDYYSLGITPNIFLRMSF